MDALAVAAEIATVLQAAGTAPTLPRRRVPHKERQEAYLAYQKETYKLMAGITHLSVVGQMKTTSQRTLALAGIPITGAFIKFLTSSAEEGSISQGAQELLDFVTDASKEVAPIAGGILVADFKGEFQLRDRVISDIGVVRDVTGNYLAALAKVYLVGRPSPVQAADVMRGLLQTLAGRIPVRENPTLYTMFSSRTEKKLSAQLEKFNECLTAIGEANKQFTSSIRLDRLGRTHPWEMWRRRSLPVKSTADLLRSKATAQDGERLGRLPRKSG